MKSDPNTRAEAPTKTKVLILCTGNSCRSQMAEGLLKDAAGGLFDVYSAGSHPAGRVHPGAIAAMQEVGIDISGHRSKHLDEFLDAGIDIVITVCGNANDACPAFSGRVQRYHWGFEDPVHARGTEEEIAAAFRETREEIRLVFEAFAAGYRAAFRRFTS
jgi:arsenate reductase (thioredoxin)